MLDPHADEEEKQLSESLLLLADKDKSINVVPKEGKAVPNSDEDSFEIEDRQEVPLQNKPQVKIEEEVCPQTKYFAQVDSGVADGKIKEGLNTLYQLGFQDFEVNFALLTRYDGDSNAAAEHLIVHGSDGVVQKI